MLIRDVSICVCAAHRADDAQTGVLLARCQLQLLQYLPSPSFVAPFVSADLQGRAQIMKSCLQVHDLWNSIPADARDAIESTSKKLSPAVGVVHRLSLTFSTDVSVVARLLAAGRIPVTYASDGVGGRFLHYASKQSAASATASAKRVDASAVLQHLAKCTQDAKKDSPVAATAVLRTQDALFDGDGDAAGDGDGDGDVDAASDDEAEIACSRRLEAKRTKFLAATPGLYQLKHAPTEVTFRLGHTQVFKKDGSPVEGHTILSSLDFSEGRSGSLTRGVAADMGTCDFSLNVVCAHAVTVAVRMHACSHTCLFCMHAYMCV